MVQGCERVGTGVIKRSHRGVREFYRVVAGVLHPCERVVTELYRGVTQVLE